jgi:putative nucleotidyltransferase with HDIG domain
MPVRAREPRPAATVAVSVAGVLGCVLWLIAGGDLSLSGRPGLFAVLLAFAMAATLTSARWEGTLVISGSFMAGMLAVAYLGPLAAFAVPVLAELGTWAVDRYRVPALLVNLFVTGAPTLAAAVVFAGADPADGSLSFYLLLGGLSCAALLFNIVAVTALISLLDGTAILPRLRGHLQLVPALGINALLALAAVGVYAAVGLGGAVFVLVSIVAFTYMARLVVTARERTRQYAALSWGVLGGLVRTLELRDGRAARHSAAVAAFARDIARQCGMTERESELAHTAGLLHDIGRFALSDRVMERSATLRESDWEGIRRHPELGADLLGDLGLYGPVAEIVRAHHERVDGLGYPDGLRGEQIPAIARIVAVAEVYDTLTADDTYRTPFSSFEAVLELRRVSGTQLDGRYVEALAELLAGRDTGYRHADAADFDREIAIERRVDEAAWR